MVLETIAYVAMKMEVCFVESCTIPAYDFWDEDGYIKLI